jgi:hypothetical protein
MNMKNLTRKIRVAAVAFFLLFGIGILSTTTYAQNDRRNDRDNNRRDDNDRRNDRRDDDNRYDDRDDDDRYDNDRNYNNRNNQNDYIMRQAYRIGFSEGSNDARSGRRPNAQRAAGQAMRQMNNGNNSRWGNQRYFRQQYREAFMRGYEEGYDRSDNRNNRRNNNRNRRNGY